MDPQQRLLLRAAAEAMPAASSSTAGGRSQPLLTGVYVGIGSNDYEVLASHAGVSVSAFSFTAASAAVASGRLAYIFGLQGPSASIDTACSASLVALHMAASSVADGTDAALVAGVMLNLVPQSTLMVQRAGMLAADGRCKVLDADADGYVRGEACRAMWLEAAAPDAAAAGLEAGSAPLAVVLGTAVNTNGRASSLTAPHGPTQQALIATALEAAGVAAAEVSGLQLHANGTSLGDPIEVGAIAPAYQLTQAGTGSDAGSDSSSRSAFVLSSIKGYAGHSEAAAGAVGVLEAAAVMLQQALAPALHVRNLNPYVAAPLQGRNAVLNRSTGLAPVSVWQQGALSSPGAAGAKVAMAVSSFGAQGTNAHAILGHSHSWVLQAGSIADSAGVVNSGSPLQQLVWQGQRFWVAPVYQRLISHALVARIQRSKRPSGLKVAFEARLDAPGLAELWSYTSTPVAAGLSAQPYLSNSVLLATAASAGSLLLQSSSTAATIQQLVLSNAVLAPPQALPANPGQRTGQMPVLLVACNISSGSIVVEVGGQRQLQCSMGATAAAKTANKGKAEQPDAAGGLSSRLHSLLGPALKSAAAAAVASSTQGGLLAAQSRQQQMQAVALLSDSTDSSRDSFVLHPAELEACLQSCMVSADRATALWLSSVQAVAVPLGGADSSTCSSGTWLASSFAHAADGSSCQIHSLAAGSSTGGCQINLTGATLAADATTATEAAAASAEVAAGVTSEEAAAAALDAVTAATNPLLQLDEGERALYLQAQIMSEVRSTRMGDLIPAYTFSTADICVIHIAVKQGASLGDQLLNQC
jgi:3-oxoacyl-(acyl-carrier-protein) synthase